MQMLFVHDANESTRRLVEDGMSTGLTNTHTARGFSDLYDWSFARKQCTLCPALRHKCCLTLYTKKFGKIQIWISESINGSWIHKIHTQGGFFGSNPNPDFWYSHLKKVFFISGFSKKEMVRNRCLTCQWHWTYVGDLLLKILSH